MHIPTGRKLFIVNRVTVSPCHHVIISFTIKVFLNWNTYLHWLFPNILILKWKKIINSAEVRETENLQKKLLNLLWKLNLRTQRYVIKNYQLSINNFHKLLLSEKDKYTVKSAYSEWLDKYEEFLLSHNEVQAWLSQSEEDSGEKRWKTYDA